MRAHLVALVCVCALVAQLAAADLHSWHEFKRRHRKSYKQNEEQMRFNIFMANKEIIENHNANPEASFKMGLNHMVDWSKEEFKRLNGFKLGEVQGWAKQSVDEDLPTMIAELPDRPIPKELDWRKVPNRVSSVRNQGSCSCCWAVATSGLLEGQQAVRNFSKIIPLSIQELVDCSPRNEGCHGGNMQFALEDIAQKLEGIESERDYPFEGTMKECRSNRKNTVMSVRGARLLKPGDEQALMRAVAHYGPVAVAVDANENFKHYYAGIFSDSTCNNLAPNHAVLAVGYGTDPKYGDFWIVKNSWGEEWGEEGYFRIKRGVNMCGIAQYQALADF